VSKTMKSNFSRKVEFSFYDCGGTSKTFM